MAEEGRSRLVVLVLAVVAALCGGAAIYGLTRSDGTTQPRPRPTSYPSRRRRRRRMRRRHPVQPRRRLGKEPPSQAVTAESAVHGWTSIARRS
jgi:hypothetical protein